MNSFKLRLFIIAFTISLFFDPGITKVRASDLVSEWILVNNLPIQIASHTTQMLGNRIYLLAGANFGVNPVSLSSNIGADGSLSDWSNVLFTSEISNFWHSSTQHSNKIYVLGGATYPNTNILNEVIFGTLDNTGMVSDWSNTTPLPKELAQGAAVTVGDRIYFAGGFNNDVIYKSDIQNDGSLGAWTEAGTLPSQMWGFVMAHSGNKLLIFGGETANGSINNVRSASLQNDGTISSWVELTPLPKTIRRGGGLLLGNVMIVAGGIDQGLYLDNVYTSALDSNGNSTTWDESLNKLPFTACCFSLASWKNHLYMTGGHDGTGYYSTVYSSVVDVEVPDPPTPTPTAVVTPTPTLIPIKTTKVVVVPGLGGSWNNDALLHCKKSDYSGGWTVAPYAVPIYAPMVKALEKQRLTVNFFGYDWRKSVLEGSQGLRAYIDSLTLPQEKVFLVGHSLGALVGEAFLEKPGNALKVEKFLAVGGPMQGMPWAYGVWAGGEIWNDNLLIQIGATLATKKCVGLSSNRQAVQQYLPVTQDLLPVFNYLRQTYTSEVIPLSDMFNRNTWLPRPLETLNLLTTIGTLSGDNKQTLSELLVYEATKKEKARGDWLDGKVFTKRRSNRGDGTVLLHSAQIPGADNRVISQTHLGLVMSPGGADAISRFFVDSTSPIVSQAFTEPTSATLVIVDNGQAVMTQPDLSVIQDASGVIAELNPKKGKHVVKIKPLQNNSKVTIGQFLSNGTVVWQEQTFSGKGERSATYSYSDSGASVTFK